MLEKLSLLKKANKIGINDVIKRIEIINTDYNAKITEIEGQIPSISGLATNAGLTAVENKIPSVSNLVEKTDYDTNITDMEKKLTDHDHNKYITIPEFKKLSAEVIDTKIKTGRLSDKNRF